MHHWIFNIVYIGEYRMKIALINMPFGRLDYPSLGLTQIQSVLGSDLGNRVQTVLLYLNHDFANRVGLKYYIMLTGNTVYPKPRNLMKGNAILKRDKVRNSLYKDATFDGMGDWIFRKEAFPHAEDNVEEYFTQYLHESAANGQYGVDESHQSS